MAFISPLLYAAAAFRVPHAAVAAAIARAPPAQLLSPALVDERLAAVLLAGGSGSRMKADRPKQFLELLGKPVLQWDLELLLSMERLERIVLVIADEYRDLPFLQPFLSDPRLALALPGAERQNSVENGLAAVGDACTLVAIHDAARPLVTIDAIERCFADAAQHGAAVLAVPCKPTIKELADGRACEPEPLEQRASYSCVSGRSLRTASL